MTYSHPDRSKVIRKPPDHGTITYTMHNGHANTWTHKLEWQYIQAGISTLPKMSSFLLCLPINMLSTVLIHSMHICIALTALCGSCLLAPPQLVNYIQCLHTIGQTTFPSLLSASVTQDSHITHTCIKRLQRSQWEHEPCGFENKTKINSRNNYTKIWVLSFQSGSH